MKLNPIGPNQTELIFDNHKVLFSYETPVAYHKFNTDEVCKTSVVYSKTTNKHVKNWIDSNGAKVVTIVDQAEVNLMVR